MRPRTLRKAAVFCIFLLLAVPLAACGRKTPAGAGARGSTTVVRVPTATEQNLIQNENARIDLSGTAEGYVGVRYTGPNEKVKVQITKAAGSAYTYNLSSGEYAFFPLSLGDGSYTVNVYENIGANTYALALSAAADVVLTDAFTPFLYANQYVDFSADSEAVVCAAQLCASADDDLGALGAIYDYVIGNIRYDEKKAASDLQGYLPDVDETLDTKKGICFDFASLMVAMLRSQNIPTKLVTGYAGQTETMHAWVSVYIEEIGWVDGIIQFDGTQWVRMDPTFASAGNTKSMSEYIGDGSNYTDLFFY
ncbi:MAG: transglutaminase-like domain-containing protein [Oscillospiraceae bacterium]|nr:transglutaminase-like domain-containing protein [Oscillospiraceae bacterium]